MELTFRLRDSGFGMNVAKESRLEVGALLQVRMGPRLATNSENCSLVHRILNCVLKTRESVTRNHSANVRNRCDAISRTFERMARAELVNSFAEKLEQIVILRLMHKDTLDADTVLTGILAVTPGQQTRIYYGDKTLTIRRASAG